MLLADSAGSPPDHITRWVHALDGYKVGGVVSSTRRSSVFSAVRKSDSEEVRLKVYHEDQAVPGESRALRELQILERLSCDGIPRALEVVEGEGASMLVLQALSGVPLVDWRAESVPSIEMCVRLGVQLARIVAEIHAVRVVHGDLTPANLLLDTHTESLSLVDFGSARSMGGAAYRQERHSAFTSNSHSLQFLAPEQSGRMGRGIDARSDLYSLGSVLYFMLTGRGLFEESDPMALVHAHMAIRPAEPRAHRHDVPRVIGEIVMKLVEKEPDDRYPDATLLGSDLEHWLATSSTLHPDDEVALPSKLRETRPCLPNQVVAREQELQKLAHAFERCERDGIQWALVRGASGMGKSTLIEAAGREFVGARGMFIAGKFDAYRSELPYAGFKAAFESLAFQILSQSDDQLTCSRNRLAEALGPLAGALVDFAPDFSYVMQDPPPFVPLGPRETRIRLALTLRRALAACARVDQPLILFLDDIQWADAGSRFITSELLSAGVDSPVFVALAMRDDPPVSSSERDRGVRTLEWISQCAQVRPPCAEIDLVPLDTGAVATLLANALAHSPEHVRPLAERLVRRTGGSPLVLREFFDHLFSSGVFSRSQSGQDRGGWTWDLARVDTIDVPEGAAGLIMNRLHGLDADVRDLVALASCVGDAFDVRLLSEMAEASIVELEPKLEQLIAAGVLEASPTGIRFPHDRVREAARALKDHRSRAELHYGLGMRLLERSDASGLRGRELEIADHLLQGIDCMSDGERSIVVSGLVRAGDVALASGTPASALRYFRAAHGMLIDTDWGRDVEQCFGLHWNGATAAFQSDEHDLALAWLKALDEREWHPLREARITGMRLYVGWVRDRLSSEYRDALLEAFARHGFRLPRSPTQWQLRICAWKTDRLLERAMTEDRFQPFRGGDLSWAAPLALLTMVGPMLLMQGMAVMFLATVQCLRLYDRYGSLQGPALPLITYAAYRAALFGDLSQLEHFTQVAREWLERVDHGRMALQVEQVLESFVLSWTRPWLERVTPLWQLSEQMAERGESDLVLATKAYAVCLGIAGGQSLESVIENARATHRENGFTSFCGFSADALSLLRQPHSEVQVDAAVERLSRHVRGLIAAGQYWVPITHWLVVLLVLERFGPADGLAEQLAPVTLRRPSPGPFIAHFVFLRACARAWAPRAGRSGHRAARRMVMRASRQLRRWAAYSEDVRIQMHFLEAERARLEGDEPSDLVGLYSRAAALAIERRSPHMAALAFERCAASLGPDDVEHRSSLLDKAIANYAIWGALGKCEQLRRRGCG